MKNIRGKLVVAAGVAVAVTGVAIARAQFVSLDGSAMHVASNPVDGNQKVTKTFDHTPAREVVEWARARNLPLTIADSDIPSRDVTLTLTEVDPIDVGPLLADALGLQAKKEGDRYLLSPTDGPDIELESDLAPVIDTAQLADMPEIPDFPAFAQDHPMPPMPPLDMVAEIPQVFEKIKKEMGLKDLKDIEKADEKTKARFKELVEKHMGEWGKQFEKKFDSKAYEKKMEAWGKDFAKKFDSPEYKAKMEAWAKKFDSPEFKAKMEKFGKDFAKQFDSPEWKAKMKAFGDQWNSPEHKAEMEKWAKEMKAHAGEMKLNDEQMKKLHEQMERLHKELGDGKMAKAFAMEGKAFADMARSHAFMMGQNGQVTVVGPDGKKQTLNLKEGNGGPVVIMLDKDGKYKVVTPGKGEKVDLAKGLHPGGVVVKSASDGKFVVVGPDGKSKEIELKSGGKGGNVVTLGKGGTYTVTSPDGKKQTITLKGGDTFAFSGPEGKAWEAKAHGFAMTGEKIKKLLGTLTDAQKELMKKQGFLTPADLTPAQRELLGDMGKGDFELSFSVDGKNIRIKNKEPKTAGSVGV